VAAYVVDRPLHACGHLERHAEAVWDWAAQRGIRVEFSEPGLWALVGWDCLHIAVYRRVELVRPEDDIRYGLGSNPLRLP
jgi:hypothetical protein